MKIILLNKKELHGKKIVNYLIVLCRKFYRILNWFEVMIRIVLLMEVYWSKFISIYWFINLEFKCYDFLDVEVKIVFGC